MRLVTGQILQSLQKVRTYAVIDLHLQIGLVAFVSVLSRVVELDVIRLPFDLAHNEA